MTEQNRRIMPQGEFLLVERFEPEARTAGGIEIPDSEQQKSNFCRVVRVGEGLWPGPKSAMRALAGRWPLLREVMRQVLGSPPRAMKADELEQFLTLIDNVTAVLRSRSRYVPGQVIVLSKWTGTEVREGDKTYTLVSEENVLAVAEEPADVVDGEA